MPALDGFALPGPICGGFAATSSAGVVAPPVDALVLCIACYAAR
jgi:hypothetical protein